MPNNALKDSHVLLYVALQQLCRRATIGISIFQTKGQLREDKNLLKLTQLVGHQIGT